ncbi:uncharacterized protein LOC128645825 [Bombina bombina]|uniref:uncharacterized protein LOC128645825 n=1 Tax=Bombina bombina TaxID=8345 RepID=UPI00235A8E3A|nr:uncharacterized protein LOC128645825 [Bombina bombina]
MLVVNSNMGTKDINLCTESQNHYTNLPASTHLTAVEVPPPPPPPPPAPPNLNFSETPLSLFQRLDTKRQSRLRNFNWEAIPPEKVRGRPSLWSPENFQGELQIDTGRMVELFGKKEEEIKRSNLPRRSLSFGDAQLNKVFLLDSRRSMNISIFLKQFKRSAAHIVEDIKLAKGDNYSSEKLNELLKQLPEREEVKRLKAFQGDRNRLSEADLFMLLLLELPSYALRLEAMILKKDFPACILSQLSAARELTGAAEEVLHCSELHFILRLVLKAGNFMNAGGYAGNAAGFRIASLLKLADTKANRPGMNLLHFVVMEVQRKNADFLSFPDKLEHVGVASRLSEEGLMEDFYKLQCRIRSMRHSLQAQEEEELRKQMNTFLEYAEDQLLEVQKEIETLQDARQNLMQFLCEDEKTFRLEECCKIFTCFCQKFQLAIKENRDRELEEQRRQKWEKERLQKRHSMAICSSLECRKVEDDLELTLERNLRNVFRPSRLRLCRMRTLSSSSPSTIIHQRHNFENIQEFCDEKDAQKIREVSERVLNQQMAYTMYKDMNSTNSINEFSLYSTTEIHSEKLCQSLVNSNSCVVKQESENLGQSEPKSSSQLQALSDPSNFSLFTTRHGDSTPTLSQPCTDNGSQSTEHERSEAHAQELNQAASYTKAQLKTQCEPEIASQSPAQHGFNNLSGIRIQQSLAHTARHSLAFPQQEAQLFTEASSLVPRQFAWKTTIQFSNQLLTETPIQKLYGLANKTSYIQNTRKPRNDQIKLEPAIHGQSPQQQLENQAQNQLPSQFRLQESASKFAPETTSQSTQHGAEFTSPALYHHGLEKVRQRNHIFDVPRHSISQFEPDVFRQTFSDCRSDAYSQTLLHTGAESNKLRKQIAQSESGDLRQILAVTGSDSLDPLQALNGLQIPSSSIAQLITESSSHPLDLVIPKSLRQSIGMSALDTSRETLPPCKSDSRKLPLWYPRPTTQTITHGISLAHPQSNTSKQLLAETESDTSIQQLGQPKLDCQKQLLVQPQSNTISQPLAETGSYTSYQLLTSTEPYICRQQLTQPQSDTFIKLRDQSHSDTTKQLLAESESDSPGQRLAKHESDIYRQELPQQTVDVSKQLSETESDTPKQLILLESDTCIQSLAQPNSQGILKELSAEANCDSRQQLDQPQSDIPRQILAEIESNTPKRQTQSESDTYKQPMVQPDLVAQQTLDHSGPIQSQVQLAPDISGLLLLQHTHEIHIQSLGHSESPIPHSYKDKDEEVISCKSVCPLLDHCEHNNYQQVQTQTQTQCEISNIHLAQHQHESRRQSLTSQSESVISSDKLALFELEKSRKSQDNCKLDTNNQTLQQRCTSVIELGNICCHLEDQNQNENMSQSVSPCASKNANQLLAQSRRGSSNKSQSELVPHSATQSQTQSWMGSTSKLQSELESHSANQLLAQSMPEPCKHSLYKSTSFTTRIPPRETLAFKKQIRTKETNFQISSPQEKLKESRREPNKASRTTPNYKSFAKTVKQDCPMAQKESPSPCAKWKRELQNSSDKLVGSKKEISTDNSSLESFSNSLVSKKSDHQRTPILKRSVTSTKRPHSDLGFGVRRVHLTKEAAAVSYQGPGGLNQNMSIHKQEQKESRIGKITHKVNLHSAEPLKIATAKIIESPKDKKETLPLNIEHGKVSENKSSPTVTSRRHVSVPQKPADNSWRTPESKKESDWTSSINTKKSVAVARMAVHVINSSLPRRVRNSHLEASPIWR